MWLIIVTLIVVTILTTLWATSRVWFQFSPFERRLPPPRIIAGDIEFFYSAKTVVSTINVTLLVFLLLTYIDIYRKTRSEFTIGLTIFSAVFLLNVLASNPLVVGVFGFQPFGLGPFALLPDLFTSGALAILLYLSIKY
jgi:predicted signal transduction protein with EAL and GGDEF domain